MKKIFNLFLCVSLFHLSIYAQDQVRLSGTVSDGNNSIENVNIKIDGKNAVTTSDKDGRYQIDVVTGDVVVYSIRV